MLPATSSIIDDTHFDPPPLWNRMAPCDAASNLPNPLPMPTTSSTRILSPHFSSHVTAYDVASNPNPHPRYPQNPKTPTLNPKP